MTKPFSINLWGSKPYEDDDCWTGIDFDTREEAERVFNSANPIAELAAYTDNPTRFASHYHDVPYIELDGTALPGEDNPIRKLREPKKSRDDDGEWRREMAMQAGMAFGCDGYNEAMGYDCSEGGCD